MAGKVELPVEIIATLQCVEYTYKISLGLVTMTLASLLMNAILNFGITIVMYVNNAVIGYEKDTVKP